MERAKKDGEKQSPRKIVNTKWREESSKSKDNAKLPLNAKG